MKNVIDDSRHDSEKKAIEYILRNKFICLRATY